MTTREGDRLLGYYLLEICVQILWSLTPSASYVVLRYLPVEGYIAIRFTLSSAVFLLIALYQDPALRIRRQDLPALFALGVCTYGLASLGTLYGLKWGGVATFALASSANAVITATAAVWLLREKVKGTLFVAMGLSVVGTLLLAWGRYGLGSGSLALASILAVWLAYAAEALGFVFSKRYQKRYSLPSYLAVLQGGGAAFMWIVSAASRRAPAVQLASPPILWLSLGFVSLVACCFCFGVHYWLLRRIEGHKLAFFDCVHALCATALGVIFFGDRLNAKMLVGGVLLVAAVVVVNAKEKRPVPS